MDEFTIRDIRGEGMVSHASTQGALTALEWLKKDGSNHLNLLDIGCGSGVLSLVAAQLWPKSRVLATDINARALADCSANIASYGLLERISVVRSESAGEPGIVQNAPYDLITANLLAEYHIANAANYAKVCAKRGTLILSGMMMWEVDAVKSAVAIAGFSNKIELRQGQWVSLVFNKIS